MLAVQLATAAGQPVADPLLVRAAASHAMLLARAWIDAPDDPADWADIAIDLQLPGPAAQRVARPPHPLCGCRWQLESGQGAQ